MESIQENRAKKTIIDTNCCLSSNSSSTTIRDGNTTNNNDSKDNRTQYNKSNRKSIKKTPVTLKFSDIKYSVGTWSLKKCRVRKEILHGVSGEFRAGELTVIMGPSGAGKSTLLNLLAGYVTRGVEGNVTVNGKVRKKEEFSRISCYIQQDDKLRPMLTARELMINTAHLKLGWTKSATEKREQVSDLLSILGLEDCQDTRCALLSGGQKKRLSIALELISNPPVLFLDEPTTGLDSSSCSQCISLLKMLAMEGRTIICTIHQPSALLFDMFDHLYALSDGRCIYQGTIKTLLPHLEKFGLQCPNYHNPADFLMEVSMGEYGASIEELAEVAKKDLPFTLSNAHIGQDDGMEMKTITGGSFISSDGMVHHDSTIVTPASPLYMQFCLLLWRNLLGVKRDNSLILIRFSAHLLIGLLFGYIYRGVGTYGSTVLGNCVFVFGSILFLVYTGKMSVLLSFPLEFKMVRREHFNRWYSLGPYYSSLVLMEIPIQIVCSCLYLSVSYPLSGQSLEWSRMLPSIALCLLASVTSQGFGLLIGITMNIKLAVFFGPVVAVILSIFGFNIYYRDVPYVFSWLFHISYFRATYQGVMFSLYNNRTTLPCPDDILYCHFKFPSKFLQEMDIIDIDVPSNMLFISVWGLCMYIATILAIWWRLNRR